MLLLVPDTLPLSIASSLTFTVEVSFVLELDWLMTLPLESEGVKVLDAKGTRPLLDTFPQKP